MQHCITLSFVEQLIMLFLLLPVLVEHYFVQLHQHEMRLFGRIV